MRIPASLAPPPSTRGALHPSPLAGLARGLLRGWLSVLVLVMSGLLSAQTQIQGPAPGIPVRLLHTDAAILASQEPRRDLPCTVVPIKPALGFDQRLHAGYEVSIPLKELAGSGNLLTMIFRVIPDNRRDTPAYFGHRVRVPLVEPDARGEAYVQGSFDLGEGKYHVDWLMRDRSERVCSSFWDVEALTAPKDKPLELALSPGVVQATDAEPFSEEPPVQRAQNELPLSVKVLINFAPQDAHAATLQPPDTAALVSILRSIAREPRIYKFSIVAFNLQQQRILYRQDDADRIDFPSLGKAIASLNFGTIDVTALARKNAETEFLTQLIRQEMGAADRPDALVFAGPKVMLDENVSQEALKELGDAECPVFYMNYNPTPYSNPWKDAIGRVVRFFRGWEYTISRPRDLGFAVNEMVARGTKLKQAREQSSASGDIHRNMARPAGR